MRKGDDNCDTNVLKVKQVKTLGPNKPVKLKENVSKKEKKKNTRKRKLNC